MFTITWIPLVDNYTLVSANNVTEGLMSQFTVLCSVHVLWFLSTNYFLPKIGGGCGLHFKASSSELQHDGSFKLGGHPSHVSQGCMMQHACIVANCPYFRGTVPLFKGCPSKDFIVAPHAGSKGSFTIYMAQIPLFHGDCPYFEFIRLATTYARVHQYSYETVNSAYQRGMLCNR